MFLNLVVAHSFLKANIDTSGQSLIPQDNPCFFSIIFIFLRSGFGHPFAITVIGISGPERPKKGLL